MSELTLCNYCAYRHLKQTLRPDWKLVEFRAKKKFAGFFWTTIYRVPEDREFDRLSEAQRERYFVASFAELTDHCVC
jgi:hypothetical protein